MAFRVRRVHVYAAVVSLLVPLLTIIYPSNLRPFEWFHDRDPVAYVILVVLLLLQVIISTLLITSSAKELGDAM